MWGWRAVFVVSYLFFLLLSLLRKRSVFYEALSYSILFSLTLATRLGKERHVLNTQLLVTALSSYVLPKPKSFLHRPFTSETPHPGLAGKSEFLSSEPFTSGSTLAAGIAFLIGCPQISRHA